MNKKMKNRLAIVGGLVVTFLVLMLMIPFLFKGKIKDTVLVTINKSIEAEVVIGDFGLNLFSNFPNATLSLNDVFVIGKEKFVSDTLLQSKSASVTIDLFSLFGGDYKISRIDLSQTSVYAKVLADGKANWEITKEEKNASEEGSEGSAFNLELKHIAIKDCNIVYEDLASNMKIFVHGWNGTVKGDFSTSETTLETSSVINEITYVSEGIPFLNKIKGVVGAKINANFDDMKFTFVESTLKLNDLEASVDGSVKYVKEGEIDFDLKLNAPEVDFKQILSLVPAMYTSDFNSIQTSGDVSLSAYVLGVMKMEEEIIPAIDLRLNVEDAMFKYPSLPKSVDNINLSLLVNGEGGPMDNLMIDLEKFSFTLGGNPFKGSFKSAPTVNDRSVIFNADGKLNLGMIKDVYPLKDGTELNGNVETDIRVATTASAIEKELYDKISAEGHIRLSDMALKVEDLPSILVKTAGLEFTPRYVDLSNFDMTLGKSDIQAVGKLENFIAYAWKNETLKGNLNVTSKYLNLDALMGDEAAESEDVESDERTEDLIIPNNIDFLLNASLAHVLVKEINITNLVGAISIKDGTLAMKNVGVNALGGTAKINGSYDTSEPKEPKVDFDLGLTKVSFAETFKQIEAVQKFAPIFEDILGTYSMNLKFDTSLKSTLSETLGALTGSGALQTNEVKLKGNKALAALGAALKTDKLDVISTKDLNLPFTIKDGGLTTKPFVFNFGEGGEMKLEGTTRLDQTIDYKGEVKLPKSLDNKIISKVPITIGGTFTSPKIGVDVKGAATDAVENLVGGLLGGKDGNSGEAVDLSSKISEEKAKQIAKIREEADKAAEKLITAAKEQGDAVVKKAGSNKIAQAAAKAASKKLIEEAEKQAQKLRDQAEEKIKKLEGGEVLEGEASL